MSGTPAQQSNSKASTVELAIEYIKSLQKELSETKEKLQAAERGKEAEKDEEKETDKDKDKDKNKDRGKSEYAKGDMETEATEIA